MPSRKLEIEIVGDSRSLEQALGRSRQSVGGFDNRLRTLSRTAGLAGAVLGGALLVGIKKGFDEFRDAEKATAQTNAVLKSTGGIANVTAKQVDTLAESLLQKSGVDDEAIKSGQNMLLTFTKIRNEVGQGNKAFDQAINKVLGLGITLDKNNDIFNQATKATLNLSVAMGKDMQSSAILVGKALNDPLKGVTALTRAGVQLDAQQKSLIKTLVEGAKAGDAIAQVYDGPLSGAQIEQIVKLDKVRASWQEIAKAIGIEFTPAQQKALQFLTEGGHELEAQKILLKELETQFGGSAEAAGKTFAGQLNLAKESALNLSAELITGLVPAFVSVTEKALEATKWLQEHPKLAKALVIGLGALAAALLAASAAQTLLNLAVLANPYVAATVAVIALSAAIYTLWQRVEELRPAIVALAVAVSPLGVAIGIAWNKSEGFRDAVVDLGGVLKAAAEGSLKVFHTAVDKVATAINKIVSAVRWLIDKIPDIPDFPDINVPFVGGGGDFKPPSGAPPSAGATPAPGVTSELWDELNLAHLMGLDLSSGRRGPRFPGDQSKHIYGKAIDVVGSAASMAAYAKAAMSRGGIDEVFYDPLGYYMDRGKVFRGAIGGHSDHVHVGVFDQGGWLAPHSRTLAINNTSQWEPVGPPGAGGATVNVYVAGSVQAEEDLARTIRDTLNGNARRNDGTILT